MMYHDSASHFPSTTDPVTGLSTSCGYTLGSSTYAYRDVLAVWSTLVRRMDVSLSATTAATKASQRPDPTKWISMGGWTLSCGLEDVHQKALGANRLPSDLKRG